MPFTLSGTTGKLVIEVTEDTKEKKNKVYTYTLFYGSDERRADFLTDGTADEYPDLAVCTFTLFFDTPEVGPIVLWSVLLSPNGVPYCRLPLIATRLTEWSVRSLPCLSRRKPPSRRVQPGKLTAPRCSSTH